MAEQSPGTRQWRLDQPHRRPPDPHHFKIPKKSEIRLLLVQLDDEEMELRRFARRLSLFPGLNRYVLAMANHQLGDTDHRVEESGHATVLLGINGLHRLLEPLLEHEASQSLLAS